MPLSRYISRLEDLAVPLTSSGDFAQMGRALIYSREDIRNGQFRYLTQRMLKVNPLPDYWPEEGRYIREDDLSPVAVAIILNCDANKIAHHQANPLGLTPAAAVIHQ